jgi:cbb3-type cytochrome oxidase cytochrome c subunit
VPKLIDEYLRNIPKLNLLFAASSIGLLLVTGWMVWDDYHRGWKGTQAEFRRLEARKVETELQAARAAVDAPALDALRKELAETQGTATAGARELETARRGLHDLEVAHYKDDLSFRTAKSTYDARKFDYEEARHHASPRARDLEADMLALEKELETLRVRLQENEKAQTGAKKGIAALTAKADDALRRIDELTATVARLETRLEKVEPKGLIRVALAALNAPLLDFVAPTFRIQQTVLDRIPVDINFTSIPRADRCQTCHLAADRAGFEEEAQPFRTHPKIDLFVGGRSPHPVDRFGCTPCHAGRDRAVDFTYAVHMPEGAEQKKAWEERYDWERDHYWEHPMRQKSRVEAGCLKCHQGVVRVPQAEDLNQGLAMVERYGCFGCHKMKGFNDLEKVGPTLKHVLTKTNRDWLVRWIRNPKEFRPSTRMPRLFGLSNHQGPGDAEREAAEILGIVAYLEDKGHDLRYPPLPGRGDMRRGRGLVRTVGCMGCHAIETEEVPAGVLQARDRREADDPIAWERRFGPDLSTVGSKLRPEWIYRWVIDPKSYDAKTRMPRLRLSAQEALDITAYLMTLRAPEPEADAGVLPQPEARDRTLLAYLSQRMTPQDARAQIDALSDRQRDVLLGEKTIQRYGCFGCHLIPGFEKTPAIGVDLSEEGSKHADLLFFGFVEIEHTSPAWFYQKLKAPRSFDEGKVAEFYDRLRMPQFDFTDRQAALVTMVLQGLTKEKVPLENMRRLSGRDESVENARRLIRDHNCQGCHVIDGKGGAIRQAIMADMMAGGMGEDEARATAPALAPPILDGEGDKVQPAWLFRFLKDPSPIRPWLQVRMPSFDLGDQEANALVHGFAAKDARSFPFQTLPASPPAGARMQAALRLFNPDYFNCWNCHQQGDRTPAGPPEGWAPDLMLARERLNPDWIARWIANPQKLMPGTRMPTYYDPEDPRGSAPPDVLGGDPQQQIDLLRDYVFTLGLGRNTRR